MNVLLLEDDLDLSAVASEQIESCGHKVFPAFDIAQAKAIITDKAIQIDILVADQLVPDGNGSQFAIETKDQPDGIKVVVVSGHLDDADIQNLDDNGVDHYDKPSLYADIVEDLIRAHYPSG
jgi:DNA-binding NtrC family response regulator